MTVVTPYGLRVKVTAAFAATPDSDFATWDVSDWNTGQWGPSTQVVDISQWVVSVETKRGFSRDQRVWESGTCTIILRNEDGRFSPDNLTGPYAAAGVTMIRPLRAVQVFADLDPAGSPWDPYWPVFAGFIDNWAEEWEQPWPGGGGATVTVTCVDAWSRLSAMDMPARDPAVWAGQTGVERVGSLLDDANYVDPFYGGYTTPGESTMQAWAGGGTLASAIKATADADGGFFSVTAGGLLRYDGAHSLFVDPLEWDHWVTVGDQPGDIPVADITAEYTGDRVVNILVWSREGGSPQTVTHPVSRALHGDRREVRTDLICETDGQVYQLAYVELQRRGMPERRITEVVLNGRVDMATVGPVILEGEIFRRVTARRTPPGGYTIQQTGNITSVAHRITGEEFTATWGLDTTILPPDSPTWDTAVWDDAKFTF